MLTLLTLNAVDISLRIFLNKMSKSYFFDAQLITIEPEGKENQIITLNQIKEITLHEGVKALVIRTLPNKEEKITANYTNTNPPFLDVNIANYLINLGVEHLLVDLPL